MDRRSNTIYGIMDGSTGDYDPYDKVTVHHDGDTMTDGKCDGIMYRKFSSIAGVEYFKRRVIVLNVKKFKAKGDKTTDDTAAFNAAIDYANSLNPTIVDASLVNGVTIVIPDGIYKITSALNAIKRSGVNFCGSSSNGSVLYVTHTGKLFDFGGSDGYGVGGGVQNLKIEYDGAITSGILFNIESFSRLIIRDLILVNIPTLVVLGSGTSRSANGTVFSNIQGYTSNQGNPLFRIKYATGLTLSDVNIFVGSVLPPPLDRTTDMTTVAGAYVFYFGDAVGAFFDTLSVVNSSFWGFTIGILAIANDGVVLQNFYFSNVVFDYMSNSVMQLQTNTGSGGVVGMFCTNCWFACWSSVSVLLTGSGMKSNIVFHDCEFVSAGSHSISIAGNSTRILISESLISGGNRKDVNGIAIVIDPTEGASDIQIADCNIGFSTTFGASTWQPIYGIYSETAVPYLIVTGCIVKGSIAHSYFGALHAETVISDNLPLSINLSSTGETQWDDVVGGIEYTGNAHVIGNFNVGGYQVLSSDLYIGGQILDLATNTSGFSVAATQVRAVIGAVEKLLVNSIGAKITGALTLTTITEPASPAAGTVIEYWDGTNKKWKKPDGSTGIIY